VSMVTPEMILRRLPPYVDLWELIVSEQYVPDIIKEVTSAHHAFAEYYDMFSDLFYSTDPETIGNRLYSFCKSYIKYREEKVEFQTTALPTGILHRGYGDCKHYASFIAGVIGSLNRLYGCCFVAYFLFVGYGRAKEPYHVYVSIEDSDQEIWVDPTPGSGGTPTLIVSKRV
jgi:hypothetical protein